jgi:hypothetical protein
MLRRLVSVAVLAVVVSMGTGSVHAQTQTVELIRVVPKGSALDVSSIGSGKTIVILTLTGDLQEIPVGCGIVTGGMRPLHSAVVINAGNNDGFPSRHRAIRTEITWTSGASLPPGTKLRNFTEDRLECCLDENYNLTSCAAPSARFAVWVSRVEVVNPSNSSPLLFTSPATATANTIGVVTGQQDEKGLCQSRLHQQRTEVHLCHRADRRVA